MRERKHPRYQDYVIRDGKLVGEFELMYQDYADPWHQTEIERWAPDKAVVLNTVKRYCQEHGCRRVIELGCGLGHFTHRLQQVAPEVLGVDIAETAVAKARQAYPNCHFTTGDILDAHIYRDFTPDIVVMAEVTWFVLEKLRSFLTLYKELFPLGILIHTLTLYPPDVQQYGRNYFSTLDQIMAYFGLNYSEWGEFRNPKWNETRRSYFVGSWQQPS